MVLSELRGSDLAWESDNGIQIQIRKGRNGGDALEICNPNVT